MLLNALRNTTCPLCGAMVVRRIVSHSGWAIHGCKACTNAWTVPPPSEVDYAAADFHASHGSHIQDSDEDSATKLTELPVEWRDCIQGQSMLLARYLPRGSRIIEIGCGEGLLLAELAKLGFNVEGIEPSETASLRARRKGLQVATGYFPQVEAVGHFDAVILSHVLEHLADPRKVLEAISKIAPNCYLLLIQSHYKGLIPRWDKQSWYAWAPHEHFWHFTPEGLTTLSRGLGFQPVACEFSSLVHGPRRTAKLATKLSNLFPSALDQFHLLLKLEHPTSYH